MAILPSLSAEEPFKQNLVPNDPELMDLLNLLKKDIMLGLNCHGLGTIETFDSETQTASAVLSYKKTRFKLNAVSGGYDPVLTDYPILADCPVVCLGGGPGSLRFPITKGDQCLVLFNDRSIDNWMQGQNGAAVSTPRLHSISDGIILVGIRSLDMALPDYDPDAVELPFGEDGTKLKLNEDGVSIESANGNTVVRAGSAGKVKFQNASFSLKSLLQDLITQLTTLNGYLQTLVTQTSAITVQVPALGTSGPPNNAAAITPIGVNIGNVSTQLNTIKTNVGALLE